MSVEMKKVLVCDGCGASPDVEGLDMTIPEQRKDAKESGWIHVKVKRQMQDFCFDCKE